MSGNRKTREQEHFDNITVNPLDFLSREKTIPQRLMIKFLLSRWDGHLKYIPEDAIKGKTVLDACCGNPRVVCWMRDRGAEAFGCDLSLNMLTMGNALGSSYTLGQKVVLAPVGWVLADCEDMPFPDSEFDTVTCFQAFHHIDAEKFLSECRRVLKPGGTLIISDPNGSHPLRKFGTRFGRWIGLLSFDEKSETPERIRNLLREAGFDLKAQNNINFFSEILFLLEETLRKKNPFLSVLIRWSLLFFYPLDYILDRTVYRIIPALSWRSVFRAVKKYT